MSLAALALRLVTVKALTGRTLAGDRVFDSEVGTLQAKAAEERAPVLLIFTDEEKQKGIGKDLFGCSSSRSLTLVIEAVVAEFGTSDGETVMNLPSTDAAREAALDLLRRQCMAAFTDTRPEAGWAELWRQIVHGVTEVSVVRGADSQNGARFAAKQISLTVDTLGEPAPGEGLVYGWQDIVEAFEADDDLAGFGALIRSELESPVGQPAWAIAQAQLGLTREGVAALGLGPAPPAGAGGDIPFSVAEIEAADGSIQTVDAPEEP